MNVVSISEWDFEKVTRRVWKEGECWLLLAASNREHADDMDWPHLFIVFNLMSKEN